MLTRDEVHKHASRKSCWVIIKDGVYDVTDFIDAHPGGASVILRYAGRDATDAYEPIHPSDTLEKYLRPEQLIGTVAPSSSGSRGNKQLVAPSGKPRLGTIINIRDFENAAAKILPATSFAFFRTGAEDEQALEWNRKSWQTVRFRPRILKPVRHVDLSTTFLGTKFSAPFFICPAGGGKLANPTGEILLTEAAGKHGILQWIYAMNDLSISEEEVKKAIELGYKGFALTVDAIRAGKRERDMRTSLQISEQEFLEDEDDSFASGPTVKRSPVWPNFDWVSAVKWLRNITDLPIAIKGIQTWEDAALCAHYGVYPWLSNHGGRQLDGAPSALETLMEIRQNCPQVFDLSEVIVDGGVSRGSDIIKAIALGAKAVGLGRGFVFALVFGEAGVNKAIRILKHEMETAMALLGVTSIDELNPSLVCSRPTALL